MDLTKPTMPGARGWQVSAVETASAALASGGRGQIIAACGTGKTITAAHVALQACPADGIILVACPTVALVAQVLQVWEGACEHVLAVCGDDGITEPDVVAADLPAVVTTDPAVIAAWLTQRPPGRWLIVTTHRSAGHLGQLYCASAGSPTALSSTRPTTPRGATTSTPPSCSRSLNLRT
jgi:predicted helicase